MQEPNCTQLQFPLFSWTSLLVHFETGLLQYFFVFWEDNCCCKHSKNFFVLARSLQIFCELCKQLKRGWKEDSSTALGILAAS